MSLLRSRSGRLHTQLGGWALALATAGGCGVGSGSAEQPFGPAETSTQGSAAEEAPSSNTSEDPSSTGPLEESTSSGAPAEDDDGERFDVGVTDLPPIVEGIPKTCAEAASIRSSVGCSFRANRMPLGANQDTAIAVGNVSLEETVTAQLFFVTEDGETARGGPVLIEPLSTHIFAMDQPNQPKDYSLLRSGETFRVEADLPIVAYQHSPLAAEAKNDSSMLIPDHALGRFHIVAS